MTTAIIFHQSGKERIVWNPATNKAAAEFLGGEFTTDDPQVQQLLTKLGYRTLEQVRSGSVEAALEIPMGKPAHPSTEAAGITPEQSEQERRRDQTMFEPMGPAPTPSPRSAAAVVDKPQPAPAVVEKPHPVRQRRVPSGGRSEK